MAAIDAIGGAAGASAVGGFGSLGSEDFAKIIFAELARQDPLEPSDTNALIQQLSGIRSIQSDMDLSDRLATLVSQNEFASATTLIGRRVSGISLDNERVTGTVKSVARTSIGAVVTLEDGTRLPATNLDEIQSIDPEPTP